MIDVDDTLREELAKLVPSFRPGNWDEVLAIAGHVPARLVRRWAAVAAFAVTVALVVSVATPLGASIVRGVGNFSSWLTGEPGTPASTKAQQAFNRANARSWIGFPAGTKLRHLTTVTDRADGSKVELLGFRAGSTLCLRIVVTGKTTASTRSCAPLADLRQAGSPVRVIVVDRGFGSGTKRAWYGTFRVHSPALQVTAGIVADGVKKVVVRDRSGRHVLPVTANAFLYVASTPDVGQRLVSILAQAGAGSLVSVPFAPAPFGFGGFPASQKTAPGPTKIERHVSDGTIGWLDRQELRGQPLSVLPSPSRAEITRHVVFGRVVAPDPTRPVRVALTLSTSRHGGRATGLCSWLIFGSGAAGGGCAVRADLFKTEPFNVDEGFGSGSDQFMTLNGLASDDVARIVVFLANGQTMKVPLRDNTFLVDVARSKTPVRLVAYDAHGRVIGIQAPNGMFGGGGASAPAQGRAVSVRKLTSPTGATAELLVGPASGNGHCYYVRSHFNKHTGGEGVFCPNPYWERQALQLGTDGNPAQFIEGHVRSNVALVKIKFADGGTMTTTPIDDFVLAVVPRQHLAKGSQVASATAYDVDGHRVGSESLLPPKPSGRRP
jgi:hypothetical protein